MSNSLLLLVDLWSLGGLALGLHYLSPRIGFAPLLMFVGGLSVLLQSQLGLYVEVAPGYLLFVNANVLVPVVLAVVLVLYVSNGAVPARMVIIGALGLGLLTVGLYHIYNLHLSLPGGGTFSGYSAESLPPLPRLRTLIASIVAFAADMFVITVFYQGSKNHILQLPEAIVVGLALLASLWVDAILFNLISDFGSLDFLLALPGEVLGKTLSGLALWPLVSYYLIRVAPRMPGYVGSHNRPTFDLLFGSFAEIKLALVKTEAALERSEAGRRQEAAYFKEISDNVHEAFWLAAPGQTHAYYVNPAYERLWGRSASEIYADLDSFAKTLHPDDRDRVLKGLPTQVAGDYEVEYRIVRPDGSVCWVRDRAFPIRNERGEVYRMAGITEDITDAKELEQQNLELALARGRMSLLRGFIDEFSHYLKNPLTSLMLKLQLLRRTTEPARQAAALDELDVQLGRMGKMIEDLLTLTRLEHSGSQILENTSVNHLVREICDGLRPIVEHKGITFVVELASARPLVRADATDLARAISNLIDNAVNYTPTGGSITVQTETSDSQAIVRVRDTGIGIRPEDQPHIFDRFFRAANARVVYPGGTGLGLSIAHKVIEQHRGHVAIVSTEGAGTSAILYLPI